MRGEAQFLPLLNRELVPGAAGALAQASPLLLCFPRRFLTWRTRTGKVNRCRSQQTAGTAFRLGSQASGDQRSSREGRASRPALQLLVYSATALEVDAKSCSLL